MHIVFKIFPAHSHLNATFKLASILSTHNYKITYSGCKEFEKEVVARGFSYFVDTENAVPPPNSNKPGILKRLSFRKIFINRHHTYAKGLRFDYIVDKLEPNLLVVDSPFVRDAISLYEKGIPFLIFESMVALNHSPLHPPLSSYIIPKDTLLSRFIIQLAWKKYFAGLYVTQQVFASGFPSKSWIKKLAKRSNFPINEIDFKRYFHIGLNNIPEIIASPLEFDFPRIKKNNQYYLGVSVTENRKETSFDLKFKETRLIVDNIVSKNKVCKPEKKIALIYCSFGSMAWRYEGVAEFYQALIKAFENEKSVQIFISIGYEMNYHLFKKLPKHIHVFRKVPQIELLKQMDLMITHGGMNTITECIMAEVPMLVYPGFKDIDQVGNACRVVFHKIGLKGSVKKDSGEMIKQKLYTVLGNPIFKTNIQKMKSQILSNNNESDIISLFDEMLKRKKNESLRPKSTFAEA